MKLLETFLQQNDLKNKTLTEQKKILRKTLIKERKSHYKVFGHSKNWGTQQFLNTLKKLNIASSDELQNKFQVACFFPIHAELDFLSFVKPNWLMPKIAHDSLLWFEYGDGKTDYSLNQWGIPERNEQYCFEYTPSQKPLLCFVPGLAADLQNYRLGYGRGFYDEFLAKHLSVISVLCLPSKDFLFDRLPHETHDIQISLIVY